MIDQDAPQIPNNNIPVLDLEFGVDKQEHDFFEQSWYLQLNSVFNFLSALRNWPKQVAQSDLAKLAAKLVGKRSAAGVIVWVAEQNHLMRWSGSAWSFNPGDAGSGYTVTFLTPPTIAGWVPCDGSTVSFLLADGALGSQVLPDTPGDFFRL